MKPYTFSTILEQIKRNEKTTLTIGESLDEDQFKDLCEALEKNTSITNLNISNQALGDKKAAQIAKALLENKTLITLTLDKAYIYDDGVKAIAQALSTANNTLQSLSLDKNKITDKGVPFIVELINKNKTLKTLSLYKNQISKVGIHQIVHVMRNTTTLTSINLCNNATKDKKTLDSFREILSGKPVNVQLGVKDTDYFPLAFLSFFTGGGAAGAYGVYKGVKFLNEKFKESKYKGNKDPLPLYASSEEGKEETKEEIQKPTSTNLIEFDDEVQKSDSNAPLSPRI